MTEVCKLVPILAGLLFVSSCTGLREDVSQKPVHLRVMTYNIRIGKGGGTWNDDPAKVDLDPIAKMIAKHNPDIVGLQEVDRFRKRTSLMNQPLELSRKLQMNVEFQPAYTVTAASGTNEGYGIAVASKFPLSSSQHLALFKPDYSKSNPTYPNYYSEQRALLHSEARINGRTVHVFVTHLGLTADQREKQIGQIAEFISQFSGPKILVGDFNVEPEEPSLQLLSAQLRDALTLAGVPREHRRSYPAGTAPTEAIDYIFVSPEFRVLKAVVIRDETLASDHNPVIADLELAP